MKCTFRYSNKDYISKFTTVLSMYKIDSFVNLQDKTITFNPETFKQKVQIEHIFRRLIGLDPTYLLGNNSLDINY